MKILDVEKTIAINATPARIWDVLVKPKYIRQWDDLPENYGDAPLEMGSTIVWPNSKLIVTDLWEEKELKLSLYVDNWELPDESYDIFYKYIISELDNQIYLTIEIGDFAQLTDGDKYYEASIEFAAAASQKIKLLAEQK